VSTLRAHYPARAILRGSDLASIGSETTHAWSGFGSPYE
jgi:hypothetical protein